MSDKIKKVTIKIEFDGTAEEEANLKHNAESTKGTITFAGTFGLFQKLPKTILLPVELYSIADIEVVRTEPNQQTQAE